MLKLTIRLFIKAFIIGVLVSIGLEQAPIEPLPFDKNSSQYEQQRPFKQPSVDTVIGFLNQAGD